VLAICVRVLSIERLDDQNPNRPKKGRVNRRRNNFDLALLCCCCRGNQIEFLCFIGLDIIVYQLTWTPQKGRNIDSFASVPGKYITWPLASFLYCLFAFQKLLAC